MLLWERDVALLRALQAEVRERILPPSAQQVHTGHRFSFRLRSRCVRNTQGQPAKQWSDGESKPCESVRDPSFHSSNESTHSRGAGESQYVTAVSSPRRV